MMDRTVARLPLKRAAAFVAVLLCLTFSGCVVVHSNFPGDQEAASKIAPFGTIGGPDTPKQTSSELSLFYSEVYAAARIQLHNTASTRSGSWTVVLDTDDAVVDANLFPGEVTRTGKWPRYQYWMNWAKDTRASTLPGAREFIDAVHQQGGHVIIVTNHQVAYCKDTRARLAELGIQVDEVLCADHVDATKAARFAAIRNGTAVPGLGPLEIAMYIGSELSDFPEDFTRDPAGEQEFGVHVFLLPDFKVN